MSHPLNEWMASKGWKWFPHQIETVYYESTHDNILIISPTGTGKTLSGFLPSFLDIHNKKIQNKIHTLYVSPLKALVSDIERNINVPISYLNLPVTVETRTGDTPQNKKNNQLKNPPNFLMITPESLALLNSRKDSFKFFSHLKFLIIDELHIFLNSKRGDLLNLNITRLKKISNKIKIIAMTATPSSIDYAKKWISPNKTKVIEFNKKIKPIIHILNSKNKIPWSGHSGNYAIEDIYNILKGNQKTIIFVNTRAQVEKVFHELWKINEKKIKIALHHGSLEKNIRKKIEDNMSQGNLDCIVSTSSLDLGIDWADINLIINIGAPKSINRLKQRIGRSNHKLDLPSKCILVPTNTFEFIECYAARKEILRNKFDEIIPKKGSLDVLSQHICGVSCSSPIDPEIFFCEIKQSFPYNYITKTVFFEVFDFVRNGGYSLKHYEEYKRLRKLSDNTFIINNSKFERKYKMNVGTIVEAPMLKLKTKNKFLGYIEERFISNLKKGDTFLFSGEIFQLESLKGLNVFVKKTLNQNAKVPTYYGGNISISSNLSLAVINLIEQKKNWVHFPLQIKKWLELQDKNSIIPINNQILVEVFPFNNKFFTVIHSFMGRNVNQTIGFLCLSRMKENKEKPLGFTINEFGLALWSLKKPSNIIKMFDENLMMYEFEKWIHNTHLTKKKFRDIALISGLVEKKLPGLEKTGKQVLFSTDIIFDMLNKYEPNHVLLKIVRDDVMYSIVGEKKLKEVLIKIKNNLIIRNLNQISPLAFPLVLESGKQIISNEERNEYIADELESKILKSLKIYDSEKF